SRHFKAGETVRGQCSHRHSKEGARNRNNDTVQKPSDIARGDDVTLVIPDEPFTPIHHLFFPPRRFGIRLLVWRTSPLHSGGEELDESGDFRLEENGRRYGGGFRAVLK